MGKESARVGAAITEAGHTVTGTGGIDGGSHLSNCRSWRRGGQHHLTEGLPSQANSCIEILVGSVNQAELEEVVAGFTQLEPCNRKKVAC